MVLGILGVLRVDLGRSVAFFNCWPLKNPETQKKDRKKGIIFLVTDHSYSYLALRPVYVNLINYISMLIIFLNL